MRRSFFICLLLAERACELTDYRKTLLVGTLAAAQAEAGGFDDAIPTAQKAIALAQKNGEPDLLQKRQALLELYRQHKACRDVAGNFVPAANWIFILDSRKLAELADEKFRRRDASAPRKKRLTRGANPPTVAP
jgi:hypothetical protein